MKSWLVIVVFLAGATSSRADGPADTQAAQLNYMLYCQGCHTPDGAGGEAVPRIRDSIGQFLESAAGRDYLVRVPGSANSILSNADLAGVLNWMIVNFGGASVPDGYAPYTAEQVGALRKQPLNEVEQYRALLLADINSKAAMKDGE